MICCCSSSLNLIGSPCQETNHRCINVTNTLFFFCKHLTKHPRTSCHPTIKLILPAPSYKVSGPFKEGFLTTIILRNTHLHKAAHVLSPNAAMSCAVPFLPLLMDWILLFQQPSMGLTPTVWLHLPPYLNLNFLPAQTTHQSKTTNPCQTGSSSPTCPVTAYPSQWDYPVSTLQRRQNCSLAKGDVSGR